MKTAGLILALLIVAAGFALAANVASDGTNSTLTWSGPNADGTLVLDKGVLSNTVISAGCVVDPSAISNATTRLSLVSNVTLTIWTTAGYDATGAAITNAAGVVLPIVTNATITLTR